MFGLEWMDNNSRRTSIVCSGASWISFNILFCYSVLKIKIEPLRPRGFRLESADHIFRNVHQLSLGYFDSRSGHSCFPLFSNEKLQIEPSCEPRMDRHSPQQLLIILDRVFPKTL